MKSEKYLIVLGLGLFALFSYFYSYYFINPVLHHHNQQLAWYKGQLFFEYFQSYPGGLAEYLTLFISQWFVFRGIGSLIIALVGFALALFMHSIFELRWKNSKIALLLALTVQTITLSLLSDYRFHYSVTVNLVLLAAALLVVARIIPRGFWIQISWIMFIGTSIYFISGGMYFLIFMASSGILLLQKSLPKTILGLLIVGTYSVLLPLFAYHYIYTVSLKYSFFKSVPDVAVMLRYSKPLLFKVALVMIPASLLLAKISDNVSYYLKISTRKKRNISDEKGQSGVHQTNSEILVKGLQIVLALAIAAVLLKTEYRLNEKTKVEIDHYANLQDWEKVISLSKDLKEYDRMVNFQFNRALLNTGQVLDRIFEYEQKLGTLGLFLDVPFSGEIALPNSDLYFDLGNIDESQRYAFESETLMKNSPRVLKRLITNCIIMDKTEAAKTYLNILKNNPVEKKWAEKNMELANNRELAANDPLIKSKRLELNKAEGMNTTPPLKLLHQLEKNPGNKKAVEYLITFDLMEHDLASLVEDLKYLKQTNYDHIPAAFEEAVILFRSQKKNDDILNRIRVSNQKMKRFNDFAKIARENSGNKEKAKIATADFKDTYWYYVLFVSPRVTNLKLETKPVESNY